MVLGWLFGENNRQPLDNLHYVRDAPGNTHGTENNNFSKYKKLYFFNVTHDFDPKIQIFLCLFLVKIRLRIVLDDAVDLLREKIPSFKLPKEKKS